MSPDPFNTQATPEPDSFIRLAPDDDQDDQPLVRRAPAERAAGAAALSNGSGDPSHETQHEPIEDEKPASTAEPMSQALRWALDSMQYPSMASADWLARDIDPSHSTAEALLSNPGITLNQVRQAKAVFKTMRIVGEKAADRRVGARMYAAAIAAGIVLHGKKVSRQSDAALKRGFQALLDDRRMPTSLRDLAGMALCMLKDQGQLSLGNGSLGSQVE